MRNASPYLQWLQENWTKGRPYLHKVAILDSARKRLSDELAEIEKLERGESLPPVNFIGDFGVGDILRSHHEKMIAQLHVNLYGGDLNKEIERIRLEKWEREAVEASDNKRRLATVKREHLFEFYERHVQEAKAELDSCIFENYPKEWLDLPDDERNMQLFDRVWSLGWLRSPSGHPFEGVDDTVLFFLGVRWRYWRGSLTGQDGRCVATLSADECRPITRIADVDDIQSLLIRTMLTFIDLNFSYLQFRELLEGKLENFSRRTIRDWPWQGVD